MSTPSYTESWLHGPKSTQIYSRTYKADHPKALLIFVHGFGEHIGRYEHVHTSFATRGITVFAYDQRGFGKTALDEKRSKDSAYGKTSWKDQVADMEWAIKYARGELGDLPTFLMGHSMVRSRIMKTALTNLLSYIYQGGGLALAFPTRVESPPDKSTVASLRGVISSSPLIILSNPPNKAVRWLGEKAGLLLPYKTIPATTKAEVSPGAIVCSSMIVRKAKLQPHKAPSCSIPELIYIVGSFS
jgi:acylglycerol lipase